MKTIKLPIYVEMSGKSSLSEFQRVQNSVIKIAYNRYREGLSEKDIREYIKTKIDPNIDSWFVQSAIYRAKDMYLKDLESEKKGFVVNRIFGGKDNLRRYLDGKIDKDQYKLNKLMPLIIIGEAPQKGNRKFNFINLESIEFKPNKNVRVNIRFPNIKNNYRLELLNLIRQSNSKKIAYQVQLTIDHIWITFDDQKLKNLVIQENKKLDISAVKNNRYIGIDLNPICIGISISDHGTKEIIYVEQIDMKRLTGKNASYKKLDHETKEVFHHIGRLCRHYNVNFCFIEDLKFKNGNKGLGKWFNRLCINQWKRNVGYDILSKYFGNKIFKVNAAYSSTIGNCLYDFSDPINASLEIGRRGYEVIILKLRSETGESKFYPEFKLNMIKDELRKQTVDLDLNSWKDFHNWLKNSKVKYRVSLDAVKHPVFLRKFKCIQSKVELYIIDCNGLYNL